MNDVRWRALSGCSPDVRTGEVRRVLLARDPDPPTRTDVVVAGVRVVSPRVDQGDVLVVNALDRVHMVADDLIAASLVLGAGAAARVEDAVVVGVGVDAIVTDDARYLVGGPGWSGAGPAAVGMMSCPCP